MRGTTAANRIPKSGTGTREKEAGIGWSQLESLPSAATIA
jgi:hypothetical protein